MPIKTPQAAKAVGISYWRIINLIRTGKLTPPAKDSSGDYIWTEADIAAARTVANSDGRRRKGAPCPA